MVSRIEFLMQAPCQKPNGLQATPEGMWIVDQATDDAILLDHTGRPVRRFFTESENASGVTFAEGGLWIGVNGTTQFRVHRTTDRHATGLLKVDPENGKTLYWFPLEGHGGVHGLEYGDGVIFVTRPGAKTIEVFDPKGCRILRTLTVPRERSHGMAYVDGALWCVFTNDRVVCKLDPSSGRELEVIEVPRPEPEPHGMTIWDGEMVYCDATTGAICRVIR